MVGVGAGRLRHGWEGEGGDKRGYISHSSFHVLFCQSAIPMLLQEYQGHQITVEGRDQSHDINNTGENVLLFRT